MNWHINSEYAQYRLREIRFIGLLARSAHTVRESRRKKREHPKSGPVRRFSRYGRLDIGATGRDLHRATRAL